MRRARSSLLLCTTLLVAGTVVAAPAPAAPAPAASAVDPATVPCSSGLVALTFDDGPDASTTPSFLTLLHERRVPATFFVVGERVRANAGLVRRAGSLGFAIGNHTYGHKSLTSLGDLAAKRTLRRTRRAIRDAGARPAPLVRPPYGAVNDRVRRLVADLGMAPVQWTVDPRDWAGRSAAAIASSTLAQLRPHADDIVVLHDGVGNSPSTLAALPRIVRTARTRGYCFARLDARGRPAPPVPRARISDATAEEAPGGALLTARVGLDRPTSRPTSVRVRTVQGSASSGRDYVAVDRRVRFAAGQRRQVVNVPVRDDLRDERRERLTLRLSRPRGMRIRDGRGVGTIRDDDAPPQVTVRDAEVVEPSTVEGEVTVPVRLRLGRASERWVRFTVATRSGTADEGDYAPLTRRVALEPGRVVAVVEVTVVGDALEEVVETFEVVVVEGTNVEVRGAAGTVTILQPAG